MGGGAVGRDDGFDVEPARRSAGHCEGLARLGAVLRRWGQRKRMLLLIAKKQNIVIKEDKLPPNLKMCEHQTSFRMSVVMQYAKRTVFRENRRPLNNRER